MSIPVALNLRGRHVYIIGGGSVAVRKAKQLVKEQAIITIIATAVDRRLYEMKAIEIIVQPFSWNLVKGDCFYLYAATNDHTLNASIKQEAHARQILFGCSMYMEDCDIYSMFSSTTEELQIALSTKGSCAGADRSLYDRFMKPHIESMNELIAGLRKLRIILLEQHVSSAIIKILMKELAQLDGAYTKQLLLALQTKQVILLAYHGIANVKQEAKALTQMEHLVNTEFPNYTCMSVFTSPKILMKAKQKGYHIAAISTMVKLLELLSVSYVIQPMLLQRGESYDQLFTICREHVIGVPLWNTPNDFMHTYYLLKEKYKQPLLGLYHSSYHLLSNDHINTNDLFLPFDQGNMDQVSQDQLIVIPLVLLYGYHAKKDIEQTWLPTLWKRGIHATLINTGLLSNQDIQLQFLEHIKQLINQAS